MIFLWFCIQALQQLKLGHSEPNSEQLWMAGNCVLNCGSLLGQLYPEKMFTIFQGKSMAQKKLRTSTFKIYDLRSGKKLMALEPHNRQTDMSSNLEYFKDEYALSLHHLSSDFINCGSWSDAVFNSMVKLCLRAQQAIITFPQGKNHCELQQLAIGPGPENLDGICLGLSDAMWPRASHMTPLGSHPPHKLATVLTTALGQH